MSSSPLGSLPVNRPTNQATTASSHPTFWSTLVTNSAGMARSSRKAIVSRLWAPGAAISTSTGYERGWPVKPGNGSAAIHTYAEAWV